MAFYRRAYAPRPLPNFSKPYSGAKTAKAAFMYKAEDVWAAAAAATG